MTRSPAVWVVASTRVSSRPTWGDSDAPSRGAALDQDATDAVLGVDISSFLYSRMSPGWQSSALQSASRVENLIALALPFFRTERFAMVMPTLSASSVMLILRLASMT